MKTLSIVCHLAVVYCELELFEKAEKCLDDVFDAEETLQSLTGGQKILVKARKIFAKLQFEKVHFFEYSILILLRKLQKLF